MQYLKFKKITKKFYAPALALSDLLSIEKRETLQRNFAYALVFLFTLTITSYGIGTIAGENDVGFSIFKNLTNRLYGLFLITFSALFILTSFEALHRSYYFKGLKQVLSESRKKNSVITPWEVANIVHETFDEDITGGFVNSSYGQEILYRLGVSPDAFDHLEATRTQMLQVETFTIGDDSVITLEIYAQSIYVQDQELQHFLSENNINEKQFVRAASWVASIEQRERGSKRWWSRDNLGKIPGIGKTWSYGQTYLLERYGHEIIEDHVWHTALMARRKEDDEVEEMEQILSRARQSNVLLITNDVLSARQKVAQLYYKIREGTALPPIEAKKIFLLDIEAVLMTNTDKASFEATLTDVLRQAIFAGNIIVYIENSSTTITSAKTIGADFIELLLPFLESDKIQIIFGETNESYNKTLSHDSRVSKLFDVLLMKDVEKEGLLYLLEQRAVFIEKGAGIVFSIQALEEIGDLAERYFPTGIMPDKAFDLLEEMVPYAVTHKIEQVLQKDVELFVKKKTNVPVGEPEKKEREMLLELESLLHKRVVAQEEAISAISKALRRARAGMADPNKPMGTFLFLGPTGVGKTETAKALAEAMFSDENAMIRLDMSEFNTPNALNELIGSFEIGESGRLRELLRERQYGILLLDEFEKSHSDIHNLFLQILDEGYFTDSLGHKVNLRNHIIIATSNAGAELIWDWGKTGKRKEEGFDAKQTLVDYVINQSIFKPELLNRFDDIIVFHALNQIQIAKIARIHIEKFAKRIEETRHIRIRITDNLVSFIAMHGYDPKFGGRRLERAILNTVEQIIADEILAGNIKQGDTFEFTNEKLSQYTNN